MAEPNKEEPQRRGVRMDDGTVVDVSGDISDEAVRKWYKRVMDEDDKDEEDARGRNPVR